jgi:GTP-binding protein
VLFASAKNGWAVTDMAHDKDSAGMTALLESVCAHIPPPCDSSAVDQPFAFSVNNMSIDP